MTSRPASHIHQCDPPRQLAGWANPREVGGVFAVRMAPVHEWGRDQLEALREI